MQQLQGKGMRVGSIDGSGEVFENLAYEEPLPEAQKLVLMILTDSKSYVDLPLESKTYSGTLKMGKTLTTTDESLQEKALHRRERVTFPQVTATTVVAPEVKLDIRCLNPNKSNDIAESVYEDDTGNIFISRLTAREKIPRRRCCQYLQLQTVPIRNPAVSHESDALAVLSKEAWQALIMHTEWPQELTYVSVGLTLGIP
jgi:hypothetical protein